MRLPIRIRLTTAFAGVMAILFAGISVSLYASTGAALLDELDTGLRVRAEALQAEAPRQPSLSQPRNGLVESNEQVAQIATLDGRILESSPGLTTALLDRKRLAGVNSIQFFDGEVASVPGGARLLAMPLYNRSTAAVLIVGSSMSDRQDELRHLRTFLAMAGPLAILLASLAGWWVAGLALRPVERMRRQASAISVSGLDRRLSVPTAHDEIRLLAQTINDLLSRLDTSMKGERRFLDISSHELRTPLTALKAELDLALTKPRSAEELSAALRSASEEADRLARLANDLLVLARANDGRLPIHRERVAIDGLLTAAASSFSTVADCAHVGIEIDATPHDVAIDPARVRQAVDNLIANALRFSPENTTIRIQAIVNGDALGIIVADEGPGFDGEPLSTMSDGALAGTGNGRPYGLGLAIVKAVAVGHGGAVSTGNKPDGGARVILTLPNAVATSGCGSTKSTVS